MIRRIVGDPELLFHRFHKCSFSTSIKYKRQRIDNSQFQLFLQVTVLRSSILKMGLHPQDPRLISRYIIFLSPHYLLTFQTFLFVSVTLIIFQYPSTKTDFKRYYTVLDFASEGIYSINGNFFIFQFSSKFGPSFENRQFDTRSLSASYTAFGRSSLFRNCQRSTFHHREYHSFGRLACTHSFSIFYFLFLFV